MFFMLPNEEYVKTAASQGWLAGYLGGMAGISNSENVVSNGYLSINLDSKLQYLFSIYGKVTVGVKVVMVCSKSGTTYTAVDSLSY